VPLLLDGARHVANDASLVHRVRCAGGGPERDLLLTGDAGGEAETRWPLEAMAGAVLKVGHHGSRSATSARALDRLRPSLAVLSVGARNPFGLPADEVLDRLRERAIPVYRTDRDGALTVELTGRRRVRGERWSAGGPGG